MPGTKAYDEPLAESHAEAWNYLDQWAIHGETLFASNALAERQVQQAPPPCPLYHLGGTAVFELRRALPPASTTLFCRRTGIHPWTFPAWN
ncbi:hypothetical protein [Streptomyces sp. NPDC057302]|uniref:hypothetical protein n=1 Tax=Streptomyces sp. NPDC057302 TaxID=3346094 RepID=UPI00363BCD70